METVGLLKKVNAAAKYILLPMLALIALLGVGTDCFASTISLSWVPEIAPDLAGYKIYYSTTPALPFTGTGATQGASPIDASTQTTATITGLDPGQAYYFLVTAYNSAGVESPYSNTVLVPELVPPTVSITSPANNSPASGTVSVGASATDNVGVTSVEFYVNGVLQSTDTSAPYLLSWNTSTLATGSYTLYAKAYDAAGNVGQSENVSVTVINDTTAPTVTLTAPGNGASVHGTQSITAVATDNIAVSKVELYANGTILFAGNVAPYSYNWDIAGLANGPYTLYARAYDAAGNVGRSIDTVVTLLNGSVSPAPGNPVVTSTDPVRTVSGSVPTGATYSLLSDAYAAAPDKAVIQAKAVIFDNGDLICNLPVSVSILGGFDTGFKPSLVDTAIKGKLLIQRGTVRVSSLVLR
jgi:chitinase